MPDIATTIQSILSGGSSPQSGNSPAQTISSQSSSLPQDAQEAMSDLGDQSYDDYCQNFVDNVLQTPAQNRAPTAADAWNNYAQSGRATQGLDGIQPGDILYFAPDSSNGNEGHTGIFTGNNSFVSATYNGVQNNNLDDWGKSTGQQILGYVRNPQNLPAIGNIGSIGGTQ